MPAQPGMGERTQDEIWMVVDVGRVPGHQRDAAARFDNSGSNVKLVDPVQDARFAAADARNHADCLLEREAFLHCHPFLVVKIPGFDRDLRCQSVIASNGNVQRLEQERFHTHGPWP